MPEPVTVFTPPKTAVVNQAPAMVERGWSSAIVHGPRVR
jgi:hypothetical protein